MIARVMSSRRSIPTVFFSGACDRNEAEGRKEVSGELVIARGDAAEILEPSEAALDDVAVLVGALVVPDALLAVGFTWDDGRDMDCQELDGSPVQP